jgi:hypothetical protein
MDYALQALVLHRNPRLPLTEAEFNALRSARVALNAAFTLEEIYDLVLGNFHELELNALQAAVSEMTQWRESYEDYFEIRAALNRRTLNLLSATRLYLDQYPQWLAEVQVDPEPVRKLSNHFYDSRFEYRFMEALRNHVQHVGLAVHGVEYGSRWLPKEAHDRLEFSVSPYTSRSSLEADKGFKARVLAECPDKVPVIPAARVYVEAISTMHHDVRKVVAPRAADARALVQGAIDKHHQSAGERLPGLSALATDSGAIREEVHLFLEWDDVRLKLVSKNRPLKALSRSYATSRPGE